MTLPHETSAQPTPARGAMIAHRMIDTPIGAITLVASSGALTGVYLAGQSHHPEPATFGLRFDEAGVDAPTRSSLDRAAVQLAEYFAGSRSTFDLDLAPSGTTFQHDVWGALQKIPSGATTTYGELAADIGRPTAARAVGAAVGRNPISIVVPCHRVIGSSGSLTGYAGGLERKTWLLTHERALRP